MVPAVHYLGCVAEYTRQYNSGDEDTYRDSTYSAIEGIRLPGPRHMEDQVTALTAFCTDPIELLSATSQVPKADCPSVKTP